MEPDRAHNIFGNATERPERPARPALTRSATSPGRDILDFKNRRPLEGFASKISAVPDVP